MPLRSPYVRLSVFLLCMLFVRVGVAAFGSHMLLQRWVPELDISNAEQVEAALETHQWALTRALWAPINIGTILLVLFFRMRIDRAPISDLFGLRNGRSLVRGAGLGIGLALLTVLPLFAGSELAADDPPLEGAPPSTIEAVFQFILTAIAVEVSMRGYVFLHLAAGLRVFRAVMGSAVVFALFQEVSPGANLGVSFLNMVLLGVVLALVRLWTGSLWATIGFSSAWNVTIGPFMGFPITGLPFTGIAGRRIVEEGGWADLSGGSFGPEGGLICTAVLALAAFAMARVMAPVWDRSEDPR